MNTNFWLPTFRTATRVFDFDYKTFDIDLGEIFVNFPLPEIYQQYLGLDHLAPFKPEVHELEKAWPQVNWQDLTNWIHLIVGDGSDAGWVSDLVHFIPSDFTTGLKSLSEEGDRQDHKNPLRWDQVRLNLPGDESFDPTFPEVMKWGDLFDRVAGDLVTFLNDLRISGYSEEHAWAIARQEVASRLQYLGIQDAPCKRRVDGGALAGAIMTTVDGRITKTISQEKWKKAQGHIRAILDEYLLHENPAFSYKFLEQVSDFL